MPNAVSIQEKQPAFVFKYPEAIAYADAQNSVFWLFSEVDVSKDIQDLRVHLTPAEYHATVSTLKLFTLYELVAGNEYWGKRFKRMFPRPEFQIMGDSFGFIETNVHSRFYNAINEALMINTEDFYLSYLDDPLLKERMEFVDAIVQDKEDLVSLGAFSMVEGAVLYSAFGYLKHFQTEGKNNLLNTVRGINYSVRDENLHCEGGSWAYRSLAQERLDSGNLTPKQLVKIEARLLACGKQLFEHESRIVDMLFEKGDIEGIKAEDLKTFVKSRINLCLANLNIPALYEIKDNPVAKWFYKNINSVQFNDFFSGMGANYNRNWDESKFTWSTKK